MYSSIPCLLFDLQSHLSRLKIPVRLKSELMFSLTLRKSTFYIGQLNNYSVFDVSQIVVGGKTNLCVNIQLRT